MYNLSIINNKRLPFLQYIVAEIKKAECRIATDYIRNFEVGKQLMLSSKSEFVLCEITYLHFYKDFNVMIDSEGLGNIVPFVQTKQAALKIYNSFPGSKRVRKLGCCAIGVKCINSKLDFNL